MYWMAKSARPGMAYRCGFTVMVSACLLLHSLPVAAQRVLEINGGSDIPWRIAVVPFAWEVASPRTLDAATLIEQDLVRYSGFQAVSRDDMLSLPVMPDEIVRWDWLTQGADFVLMGKVHSLPEQVDGNAVRWYLYDVSRASVVLSGLQQRPEMSLRQRVHGISDQVHRYVLGVQGINNTSLLYISVQASHWGRKLYRLRQSDADGGQQKTLFSSNEPILSPTFSPDGRRIAFSTFRGDWLRIQILDLATGRMEYPGPWGGYASEPAFSPQGNYLALTLSRDFNPDIYIYHLKSGRLLRLTQHFAIDAEPVWSPDGRFLLFTSDRSGTAQLYQFNLLTGEQRRLTFTPGNDGGASLLPGGRHAVFLRSSQQLSHIALLNLETLTVRPLTENGLYEAPSVAPDGNVLIYATGESDGKSLAGLRVKGGERFELGNLGEQVHSPAWSPLYQ